MNKVKITVLRRTLQKDLAEEYGIEGLGACPLLQEGQVFYADYARPDGLRPVLCKLEATNIPAEPNH